MSRRYTGHLKYFQPRDGILGGSEGEVQPELVPANTVVDPRVQRSHETHAEWQTRLLLDEIAEEEAEAERACVAEQVKGTAEIGGLMSDIYAAINEHGYSRPIEITYSNGSTFTVPLSENVRVEGFTLLYTPNQNLRCGGRFREEQVSLRGAVSVRKK